jgi:hypothetical protein
LVRQEQQEQELLEEMEGIQHLIQQQLLQQVDLVVEQMEQQVELEEQRLLLQEMLNMKVELEQQVLT